MIPAAERPPFAHRTGAGDPKAPGRMAAAGRRNAITAISYVQSDHCAKHNQMAADAS